MADKPKYASIIDEMLDEREPNWKELGLKDAKDSGDDWLARTHDEIDSLVEDITGDAEKAMNKNKDKRAVLQNRLMEKEAATPRLGANTPAGTRLAARPEDYKNSIGDDKSLFDEVTESLDSAESNGKLEKKQRSDAEIKRYIDTLLNEGVAPAKVAAKLNKLAELELFNKQTATDYLNRNAGMLGIAYLQPNSFMDSCPQTYERLKVKTGGQIRAKSVKQISACQGCSHFKKNGNQKNCSLYRLPVVGNAQELAGVVNKITAGVPANSKKAALVQIANKVPQTVQAKNKVVSESPFVHQASFTHERTKGFAEPKHFGGAQVMKLHKAGHGLQKIVKAAEKQFGVLETSRAVREFVASLKATKGKIVMAKADAEYLKKMGIHNAAIVGAAKCASCSAHTDKATHKAAKAEGVTRVSSKLNFSERSLDDVRTAQSRKEVVFDGTVIAKLHKQGHSLKDIHKMACKKLGDVAANKGMHQFIASLKGSKTKVALSELDCKFLKNKLGMQNAIEGASKCASCNFRNGMACSYTGGTLISVPGLEKAASNHKIASGAPEDGRAMLKEFDLYGDSPKQDIEYNKTNDYDIQVSHKPDVGEI